MGVLEDLLANQPGASGGAAPDEDNLGFIGMPKGYVATTPGVGGPVSIRQAERGVQYGTQISPPKYKTGAEMEPRGYSPEMIARLQQQLAAAGLIGPQTRFRLGVWDSASVNAYRNLLSYANQGGIGREDALQDLLANPSVKPGDMMGGVGGSVSAGPQFSTRLNTYEASDPASVRQTAEAAFKQALGRKPKKDELAKFMSGFLGREKDSQGVVFAAQDRLEAASRDRAMQAAGGGGEAPPAATESDELWNRLQRMVADSPYKIGLGKRSRSYEEQVRLWNNYKAGKGAQAARPGTSKHGNGRANDLQYSSEKARQWALANAHKYGIHFPLYNPKLARSKDESWHAELRPGAYEGLEAPQSAGAPAGGDVPLSEDVTVQRQDMGAQAMEFAEMENPVEKRAYDIGGQFNNFVQILQRGVI
jgi:hypothetical protein